MIARYLSHPQVTIDPAIPVPEWGLNAEGAARVARLAASNALAGTTRVISSAETKAIETAKPLAKALGCPLEIREAMHENDRSATGFLPPDAFEATADAFFAQPDTPIRGWETARAAQARIVREVRTVLTGWHTGDCLFVGHGGVGTLLWCHLAGRPIARANDQPPGGGNLFAFPIPEGPPHTPWQPMEALLTPM